MLARYEDRSRSMGAVREMGEREWNAMQWGEIEWRVNEEKEKGLVERVEKKNVRRLEKD